MADQTPNPPVPPVPKIVNGIPPLYGAIIALLTAITAALSGMKFNEQPTPPKPTPHVIPNDKTDPAPRPDEVPTPVADTPVAAITVLDCYNHPLAGDVSAGQLLIFTAEKAVHGTDPTSLKWNVDTQVQQWREGTKLIIVTPLTGATINIQQTAAINSRIDQATVTIKSGHAPNPPPKPDPKPQPEPEPEPAPGKVKNVSISVIDDPNDLDIAAAKTLNNFAMWSKFVDAGNTWRIYPPDTEEPNGKQEISEVQSLNLKHAMTIRDKDTKLLLYKGPLTTIDDVKSRVNQFTGSSF